MTPGTGSTLNYGFDASSNLTTLPTGAAGTYDNAGELTSSTLSGTTTSYTYNADGQQLNSKQGNTTLTSGTWNGAGQLTNWTSPAASMTTATYNGDGLRTALATSAGSQAFTWSSVGTLPHVIMDSSSAYIYGGAASGETIAPLEQVSLVTGTISYLVKDYIGSVRGVVSSSGTLTATATYDSWGNPMTGQLGSLTPYGYAGAYTDQTGLLYEVDRYLDPATGQFLSADPMLQQTLVPYVYADGNPVSRVDPTGQAPDPWKFKPRGRICGNGWVWCVELGLNVKDEFGDIIGSARINMRVTPYGSPAPAGSRLKYTATHSENGYIFHEKLTGWVLCYSSKTPCAQQVLPVPWKGTKTQNLTNPDKSLNGDFMSHAFRFEGDCGYCTNQWAADDVRTGEAVCGSPAWPECIYVDWPGPKY